MLSFTPIDANDYGRALTFCASFFAVLFAFMLSSPTAVEVVNGKVLGFGAISKGESGPRGSDLALEDGDETCLYP